MANNLKKSISRMRSSISGPKKRKRETDFDNARSFYEYEQTFTQENERSVKERTAYRVKLPIIQQFSMTTATSVYEGKSFENEFFDQFRDGLELANSTDGWNRVHSREYKLVRVTGFDKATIDFIAYNLENWFPVEVKDQRSGVEPVGTRRKKKYGIVGFRNQKQFQRLYDPDETVVPASISKRWITDVLEELPGIVIKRVFVKENDGWKANFCDVLSVSDSFV